MVVLEKRISIRIRIDSLSVKICTENMNENMYGKYVQKYVRKYKIYPVIIYGKYYNYVEIVF